MRERQAELEKKQYTYDFEGDIIFVKEPKVESLGKDCNLELRYNFRTAPKREESTLSPKRVSNDFHSKPKNKKLEPLGSGVTPDDVLSDQSKETGRGKQLRVQTQPRK